MTLVTALFIGQSQVRGSRLATDGSKSYPAHLRLLDNDEEAFGTRFIQPKWGRYPLDRKGDGQRPYANHIVLGVARRLRTLGERMDAAVVSKGGHPIECFISAETRTANGWTVRPGLADLSPFIYSAQGVLSANGGNPFDLIIKLQGEANFGEFEAPDTMEAYQAKEIALITDLETAGIKGPDTVYLSGLVWNGHEFYETHKAAVGNACACKSRCYRVDSQGLRTIPRSIIHFTGTALGNYGKRFANHYLANRP